MGICVFVNLAHIRTFRMSSNVQYAQNGDI